MGMLDVEILGLQELRAKTDQMITDLHGKPMLDGMRQATLLVSKDAKQLAPVDTGELRSSITPEVRLEGWNTLGVVGSNKLHAPYMETGTKPHWPPIAALEVWARRHGVSAFLVARAISRRGTKAHRYMQRAFDQNKDQIVSIFDKVVTRIVNK